MTDKSASESNSDRTSVLWFQFQVCIAHIYVYTRDSTYTFIRVILGPGGLPKFLRMLVVGLAIFRQHLRTCACPDNTYVHAHASAHERKHFPEASAVYFACMHLSPLSYISKYHILSRHI